MMCLLGVWCLLLRVALCVTCCFAFCSALFDECCFWCCSLVCYFAFVGCCSLFVRRSLFVVGCCV